MWGGGWARNGIEEGWGGGRREEAGEMVVEGKREENYTAVWLWEIQLGRGCDEAEQGMNIVYH